MTIVDPCYRVRLARTDPAAFAQLEQADAARAVFAADLGVTEMKWSGYNVSRLLRLTGERPGRVAEMWAILGALGLGNERRYPGPGGVFDHGILWGRDRTPVMLVGHPYGIDAEEHELLRALARFTTLRVSVNDRPGYYGFGTDHVRVTLTESRRPFKLMPATHKTRAAARAARKAFAEEMGSSYKVNTR